MNLKRLVLLGSLLLFTLAFLTGCMESYTSFIIYENGTADVTFTLIADLYMAAEESEVITYSLRSSIMELQTGYTYEKEIRTVDDYDYVYHTFQSKGPVDITNHEYITFVQNNDGTYSFIMDIPKMVESVTEDTDSLMFSVDITLPGEIIEANTTYIEGRRAVWSIYKSDLTEDLVLKAIAK